MELIQPHEIEVRGKRYTISKFPATVGREIIYKYPLSNAPKFGEYQISHETMLKLMQYVEVETLDGRTLRLSSETLVNNHVPDWESLALLEKEMLVYNCSFFQDGRALSFLTGLIALLEPKTTATSTNSSAKSSPPAAPASTN